MSETVDVPTARRLRQGPTARAYATDQQAPSARAAYRPEQQAPERPAPPAPAPPERWRLVGPGIKELPSPDYLASLDEAEPGALSAILEQVEKDIAWTRRRRGGADHHATRVNTLRVYAALGYAGLSLPTATLLILFGHAAAGTLLLAIGGVALLCGLAPWAVLTKPARSKPAPGRTEKPARQARDSSENPESDDSTSPNSDDD